MNIKLVIVIVAVLVFGFGGYYVMKQRNDGAVGVDSGLKNAQKTSDEVGESSNSNSLRNFLSAGAAQTCTFDTSSEGYKSSGIVYFEGGKMRGDFETEVGGKQSASHMVVDNKTGYLWTDGQSQGFKMEFDDLDINAHQEQAESMKKSGFDFDANLNYDCKPGNLNRVNFTLPTNVNFVSPNEMMKELSANCSVCDSLEGEAQTQCKVALKCN